MDRRFLKDSFFLGSSAIVRIVISIITIPLLTRLMGLQEYGIWVLASTIVQSFIFLDLGFSTSATVFISQSLSTNDNQKISETLTVIIAVVIILATLIACLIFVSADPISSIFRNISSESKLELQFSFRIGAIAVWLRLIQQTLIGVERSFFQFKKISFLSILDYLLLGFGQISLAISSANASKLMILYSIVSLVVLVFHILLTSRLLKDIKLSIKLDSEKAFEIIRYSFFAWMTSLGGVLFARGDRIIVGIFLNPTSVSIYTAFVEIASSIYSLSALIIQPIMPIISSHSLDSIKNSVEVKQKIRFAFHTNASVALSIFIFLFLLPQLVIQIMLGQNQVNDLNIFGLRICLLIYTISCFKAMSFYIALIKAEIHAMVLQLASALLTLLLIYFFSKFYGLLGAIIGNVGFLMTLLFNNISMKAIDQNTAWLFKPINFLLVYFFVLIFIVFSVPMTTNLNILILIISELIILLWFSFYSKFRRCLIRV